MKKKILGVSFETSKYEDSLIAQIAARADAIWPDYGKNAWALDVTAVHCNGCQLRLHELLASGDAHFAHDLGGIRRHLDRDTGKLPETWHPRFALS